MGWSGDTEFFIGAATYNADAASFFNKWASDCSDSQLSNGAYTDTIPASYANGSGNTAWADAGIIVPYVNYVMYNNTELIEKHYPSMQKYMAFLSTRGYLGANPGFGDWLSYEHTDPSYISMAYYAYTARLMSEMARAIDKSADCERYEKLYQTIKQKFIAKYVNADGTLKIKTQTSYLLALKIQLLPDEDAHERAAEALVKKIKANSGRLSTGFVGTSTIAQTLGACEKNNAAYTLLLQRGNPSWLYSVDQGATTIWERWNSYTKETGFGDATMNSFNHYSFGAVEEWMYRYMAGIEADGSAPGFKKFILQPTPDTRQPDEIPSDQSKITAVSASYNSMYGEITSEWSTADGVFDYKATVPANTCAQLKFPTLGENAVSVIINGVEVNLRGKNAGDALADGVTYIGREGKTLLLSLQPGSYDIKEGRSQLFPVTGITLDRSKLSLNIGEAYKLSASFEPADTTDSTELSFISSASHIASVGKDGTITAVSAGSAVITAALDKNPLIKAACTVTVRAENNGISVNKLSLSGRKKLAVGKKAKLKVKTYPENASDKRISFISSAKSVITVSEDGTMTAKSPGKAIITALANGGASGSVAVTVLPRAPRIKK